MKLTWEVQLRMSAGVPIKVDKPVFPWMEFPSQKTNSNRKGRQPNQGPNTQQPPNRKLRPSAGVPDWAPRSIEELLLTAGLRDSLSHYWRFYIMGHKQNFCWKWLRALFRDTVIISMSLSSCCFFTLQNQRKKTGRTRDFRGTLGISLALQSRVHEHAQKRL